MNNKRLLILFLSLSFTLFASAQIIEKIVMKNGSVLEGHITSQVPGKNLTFFPEIATILSADVELNSIGSEEMDVDQLEESWKKWVEETHPILIKRDGHSYLKLDKVRIQKKLSPTDKDKKKSDIMPFDFDGTPMVKILEHGVPIKFVCMYSKEVEIPYSAISEIQKIPRSREVMSGTTDQVETTMGTYAGQIISQKLGENIKILCDETNDVMVIPVNQVKSQRKLAYNTKMSLLEQTPYLDVVKHNGKNTRGVIVRQEVKTEKSGSYILVETNGNQEYIQNSDIELITKEQNPDYKKPVTDIIIENDSIYLCRVKGEKAQVKKQGTEFLYVEGDVESLDFAFSKKEIDDGLIVVECFNEEKNRDIVIVPVVVKEVKVGREKKKYYAFTFVDLAENTQKPTSTSDISPNNTLRKDYELKPGKYALYVREDQQAILFEVKE